MKFKLVSKWAPLLEGINNDEDVLSCAKLLERAADFHTYDNNLKKLVIPTICRVFKELSNNGFKTKVAEDITSCEFVYLYNYQPHIDYVDSKRGTQNAIDVEFDQNEIADERMISILKNILPHKQVFHFLILDKQNQFFIVCKDR